MLHNICLSMYLLHNYLNEINFIMKTNFIFCCIYDCPVFLGLLINIDQRVTIINELLKSNECYGKKSGEGAFPPPQYYVSVVPFNAGKLLTTSRCY